MKYGKFLSALAVLSALAIDGSAGTQVGAYGSGAPGFVEVHGGEGRHFGKGGHFRHGHRHHFGHRHHHHKHGGTAVIIGVPLFWSGYQAVQPYRPPPPPQAFISQGDVSPVWYYCDARRGYYPYVAACPGGWRAVDSTLLPQW